MAVPVLEVDERRLMVGAKRLRGLTDRDVEGFAGSQSRDGRS